MKKLAVLLAAIAMIATFAVPAMATDVGISGEFRVLTVYNDKGDQSTAGVEKFIQQRFRTMVTLKVNDNVSAFLRTDLAEETWGLDGTTGTGTFTGNSGKPEAWRRPTAGSYDTLQVDRSYVQIKSGMFTLKAGQQYGFTGLPGTATLFEGQFFGLVGSFNLKPFSIDLIYSKLDENGATYDTDDANNGDEDAYVAQVKYMGDNFTLGGIIGERIDRSTANRDNVLKGYGFFGSYKAGQFTIQGELDLFDGEVSPISGTAQDYTGTQLIVVGSYAMNDALTVAAGFLYAKGDENDNQATTLYQFGIVNSPLEWEGQLGGTTGGYGTAKLYDADGTNSGIVGGLIKAKYLATDALTLWAKAAYVEPEDNNTTTALDNVTYLIGEADWQWMPNVTISGGVQYASPNYKVTTSANDHDELMMTAKLGVSF